MARSAGEFANRLQTSLATFDRPGTEATCRDLEKHLAQRTTPYPEKEARQVLQLLRRKRQFDLMGSVADQMIQCGQDAPVVKRQYAQALIDLGHLTAGVSVLDALVRDSRRDPQENAEALGLIGRAFKQEFVNAADDHATWSRRHLERSLKAYLTAYRHDPDEHLWHGVNVAALAARARSSGLRLPPGTPKPEVIATDILARLTRRQKAKPLSHWDWAIGAEASLALDKPAEDVLRWLVPYVQSTEADAFELASTLRQLEEVWLLRDTGGWAPPSCPCCAPSCCGVRAGP